MKNKLIWLLVCSLLCLGAQAQSFVNLTPRPKQMTAGEGEFVLPAGFTVGYGNLPDSLSAEARKFVTAINGATALGAAATAGQEATVVMQLDETLAPEGYAVDVTAEGVTVKGRTAAGFYYAFQTLKKILPANVMAGVRDESVTRYALPLVSIQDEPRFGYRGFMLDVARHFFTVDEVKRMLELMSYYKMNRFHWHLADDQGWRIEIKKYPKLTSVGATAPNSYGTSLKYGPYWTNEPYGPYFYTQDEIRDIVAYAAERHIEIIPEIDMPGHSVATLVAYPEFSCNPDAAREVWVSGGISSDVLNVANPATMQFVHDVLDEITALFPHPSFHIGGDECPTSAWEGNALCQQKKEALGLKSFRELQSLFVKDIADYLATKGKKINVWNEAITYDGADVALIKSTDATVWCWTGADAAARKAVAEKLHYVFTPWGPGYINRRQSLDWGESTLPGNGSDTPQATYNINPLPGITGSNAQYCSGVQGTFWTEHIADAEVMEYQALPRLIAIAELGWTSIANKNYEDFRRRFTADTLLLDYNRYNYARHILLDQGGQTGEGDKVMPKVSDNEQRHWYRLVTRGSGDGRSGKCMELLREGSPIIAEQAGKNAQAGRLWLNTTAQEGDDAYAYQWWALEADPAAPGKYALVCMARPEGSVNPTGTAANNTGRWNYDDNKKNYNFILADNGYGQDGDAYYYSIRSDRHDGVWMNAALGGQGFAVNLYNNPADGNGGLWNFLPLDNGPVDEDLAAKMEAARQLLKVARTYEGEKQVGRYGKTETDALRETLRNGTAGAEEFDAAYDAFRRSFGYLETGRTYRLSNTQAGKETLAISDNEKDTYLRHAADTWCNDAWEVTAAGINADWTQTVTLRNAATGRFVATRTAGRTDRIGHPVSMGTAGTGLVVTFDHEAADFTLALDGKSLFPIPETSRTYAGIISSGSTTHDDRDATRMNGNGWNIQEVRALTYVCQDEAGKALGTFRRSCPVGEDATALVPEVKNHEKVSATEAEGVVTVVYRRCSYSVVTLCTDTYGAIIAQQEAATPVGESFTVSLPELPYYTFESTSHENGTTLTPTDDVTVTAVYSTTGYNGVKAVGAEITDPSQLKGGMSYLIYDDSPADNGARKGFRTVKADGSVNRVTTAEGATPYTPWTFVKAGNRFRVRNEYLGQYIPVIPHNSNPTVAASGDLFTFSLNADGTWRIQGSNGECWDGQGNGNLVSWTAPGHPHRIYSYWAEPYFEVTVIYNDKEGRPVDGMTKALVKAGDSYTVILPEIDGYVFEKVEGLEQLQAVSDNITVKAIYAKTTGIGGVQAGEDGAQTIHDLSGRRLNAITGPGLYIVNGQKVLVK